MPSDRVTFSCPNCGKLISMPTEKYEASVGKKGRCVHCKDVLTVPTSITKEDDNVEEGAEVQSPTWLASGIASAKQALSTIRDAVPAKSSTVTPPPEIFPAQTSPPSQSSVPPHLTTEGQDSQLIAKMVPRISEYLTSDELLCYVAVQKRPVVNIAPDCIVLTSKRFMFYRMSVLGRVQFEDFVWRELSDAKITEGILGATFSIRTASGVVLSMDYVPKSQARKVYRFAQEQEEAMLEVRRARAMEEKRAAAGGVIVQGPQFQTLAPTLASQPGSSPMAKLQELKSMLDAGLISLDDFELKKASILSQM